MKKFESIVVAVAIILVIFYLGFANGSYNSQIEVSANIPSQGQASVQSAPVQQAQTPSVQTPSETEASTEINNQDAAPTENDIETSDSKADSIEKVVTAINNLKQEQNVKAVKTEKTVINITDCSASALTNILNSVCQKIAGEKVTTYNFSGGQAVGIGSDGKEANDGKTVSPKDILPPKEKEFKLNENGVKNITEEKDGNATKYIITLINEESTLDKSPVNNEEAVGYLNLGGFNIPTVSITQADINYPETVITVVINDDGKVAMYKYEQPMEGSMGCKIAIVSASAEFDGGNYETWEFTY